MKHRVRNGLLVLLVGLVAAATGPRQLSAKSFWVGGWADALRTATCVTAPPGAMIRHEVWALVPPSGAAYVTIRFRFPASLAVVGPPQLAAAVADLIVTPYPDGTSEWNLLLNGCPTGWVPLFGQDLTVEDPEPTLIAIRRANSMIRDCTFVLRDVEVANELDVNTPGCEVVATGPANWGGLKSRYR